MLKPKRGDQYWSTGKGPLAVCWAHFDVGFLYRRELSLQLGKLVIRIGISE